MNEEAKKIAIDYLQKLLAGIEKGVDFAGEQIPLVLQEIVAYGRVYETFLCSLLCLVLLVLPCIMYYFSKKFLSVCSHGDEPAVVLINLVPVILWILALISFCDHIDNCLKAWFAPRLYLIEYLHNLIK